MYVKCDLSSAQKPGVAECFQQSSYTTQHALLTSLFLWGQLFLNAVLKLYKTVTTPKHFLNQLET